MPLLPQESGRGTVPYLRGTAWMPKRLSDGSGPHTHAQPVSRLYGTPTRCSTSHRSVLTFPPLIGVFQPSGRRPLEPFTAACGLTSITWPIRPPTSSSGHRAAPQRGGGRIPIRSRWATDSFSERLTEESLEAERALFEWP